MEEAQLPDELMHSPERGRCANCNNPEFVEGFATHLCTECRQRFIKYPIPLWIKIFGGAICLVVLFSLYKFPENLSMAIHRERGKEAGKENKYATVRKEFEQVLKREPQNVEAKGYLMLASFYNEDYGGFLEYSNDLDSVEFEDKTLLSRLNDAIDQFPHYYPDGELTELIEEYDGEPAMVPDTVLQHFLEQHPENILALYLYASRLYDNEKYSACETAIHKLLDVDLIYLPALRLMSNCKRQSGDLDSSLFYCRRILEINRESAYGYALMARAFLKFRKDKEGMEMAQKSMSINDTLPFNIATLALAYHFNNEPDKRDQLIHEWDWNDSAAAIHFQYAVDVIEKKEPFRN